MSATGSRPTSRPASIVGAYLTDQKLPGTLTLGQSLTTPTLANPAAIAGNQSRKVETERIANRTSFLLDVGKLDIDTWAIHKNLLPSDLPGDRPGRLDLRDQPALGRRPSISAASATT